MTNRLLVLVTAFALVIIAGCGQRSEPKTNSASESGSAPSGPVSMNKADYPVFPDATPAPIPPFPQSKAEKGSPARVGRRTRISISSAIRER